MGGKSSGNDEITNLQKEQAAEARAKETARQGRINQGLAAIRNAFLGGPVMGTRATTGAPTTTRVQGPPTTQKIWVGSGNGGGHWETKTVPGAWKTVTTQGAAGTEEYDTGERSGGFDQAFYDKYNNAITSKNLPEVAKQYTKAKEDAEYALARARTSKSSAANKQFADLAEQNTSAEADVRSAADAATGALRSRVASEQAKAEAQLYATENPEVAANQALAAVNNISLDEPAISPLGEVFKTALIGGANAVTGFKNQQQVNNIRTAAADAAKVYN